MKRKKIMLTIMIAAVVVLSYSAKAQKDTTYRSSDPVKTQQELDYQTKTQQNHTLHQQKHNDTMVLQSNKVLHQVNSDGIMMQNGKMVMMKDGKTMPMHKDMTMKNGTICMTNGTCKMKDGTTMMMKEGDMIDMNGKMITAKKTTPK